jgi:hypothetical protein
MRGVPPSLRDQLQLSAIYSCMITGALIGASRWGILGAAIGAGAGFLLGAGLASLL